MKAAVTIVPFTDMPCWWWLHHLTPPVELKTLQIVNHLVHLVSCKREESTQTVFPFLFFLVLRKGYEAAAEDFEPEDLDVSVVGRSFMITGANSGIGRATAIAVAKQGRSQVCSGCERKKILSVLCSFSGGTVHMLCRNRERAEEARECIVNESGNTVSVPLCWEINAKHVQISDMHSHLQEVHIHIVDMAETRKVWEFAESFKQQYPSLNVLVGSFFFTCWLARRSPWMTWTCNFFVWYQINNAGCMVHKRELNAEGLEKNFATNTMGETSTRSLACLPSNLITEEAKHVISLLLSQACTSLPGLLFHSCRAAATPVWYEKRNTHRPTQTTALGRAMWPA